jgi:hypothetical protein
VRGLFLWTDLPLRGAEKRRVFLHVSRETC